MYHFDQAQCAHINNIVSDSMFLYMDKSRRYIFEPRKLMREDDTTIIRRSSSYSRQMRRLLMACLPKVNMAIVNVQKHIMNCIANINYNEKKASTVVVVHIL